MRRKNKNIYILIIIFILGISIGYAAMNKSLNITGSSNVLKNTWDIYFSNPLVTSGSVNNDLPVIDSDTKTTVNFSTILYLPGDFYEFSIDVVNAGTIDAMLESVENTINLTDEQKKYIDYTICYQCGEEIASKQLVNSGDFVRIKVRVEYKTNITETDLPTVDQNLDLSFNLNYIQADSSVGVEVKNNGIICTNGDINDIGTIVTIGTEKFYTIGTDEYNVKLLSMYNLYVGNEVFNYDPDNEIIEVNAISNPTGMQSEKAKGAMADSNGYVFPWIGTIAFANEEKHGINYTDYQGSLVEEHVNNYKDKLEEKFDVDIVDARLITKEELIDSNTFACDENKKICNGPYPWIHLTSYWTSSASSSSDIWRVYSYSQFQSYVYDFASAVGVRPVIIISKTFFS